jgi:hypothetical protein
MPNSTGGNAIGSPTFSDSSTRKTSGSRTRKPTIAEDRERRQGLPVDARAQNARRPSANA